MEHWVARGSWMCTSDWQTQSIRNHFLSFMCYQLSGRNRWKKGLIWCVHIYCRGQMDGIPGLFYRHCSDMYFLYRAHPYLLPFCTLSKSLLENAAAKEWCVSMYAPWANHAPAALLFQTLLLLLSMQHTLIVTPVMAYELISFPGWENWNPFGLKWDANVPNHVPE